MEPRTITYQKRSLFLPKEEEFEHQKEAKKRSYFIITYYMVIFSSIILALFGLLVTFSATTVSTISAGANPYSSLVKTVTIAFASFLTALILSRLKPFSFYRFCAIFFAFTLVLQILVLFIGIEEGGNTNWLEIPGTGQVIQPSEFLKATSAVFYARILSNPRIKPHNLREVCSYFLPVFLLPVILVLLGSDLGTAAIFLCMGLVCLWVSGAPLKWFPTFFLSAGLVAGVLVLINPSRITRILSALTFFSIETNVDSPTQLDHALWALGSGGLFGLGSGASKEKWNYLQEAHTDFILAIVGEEFGFVGIVLIVVSMIILLIALIRVILGSRNIFIRLTTSSIFTWFAVQSIVNVGSTIGLLPVVGLPFPLVSYGGSSFLAVCVALAIVISFIRYEAKLDKRGLFSFLYARKRDHNR